MIKYEIIDNFLPTNIFNEIQHMFFRHFTWTFAERVGHLKDAGKSNDSYYFHHLLYNENQPFSNFYDAVARPIYEQLGNKLNSLVRMKANLYPSTPKIIEHDFHVDYPFKHKGALLSINTCDGYTMLEDGTKIDSVENRILFFDSSLNHASTTCTNERVRVNLNINYF